MSKARDLADILASGSILSDGVISTTEIDGITATAAELNILDGVTATTAELNYVDGVTSNIQTQLDNISVTSGSLTKTFVADEVATITLSGNVVSPVVGVTKEVSQTGVTNNTWDVNSTTENYTRLDSATATTLDFVGFDISTATYSQSFSVSSQHSGPYGMAFNTDGTKMFVVGLASDTVSEYTLSTGFDVSTATYSQDFSVASEDGNPSAISFNSDGTKMFVLGYANDSVYEYTLSTGFDVSTASYSQSFSVASQDGTPEGLAFNTDGTKMFVVGRVNENVYEYTLSTGFDVSTASYSQSFSILSEETNGMGIAFNADGTKMFIIGTSGDDVNEYSLSTGFDVSTASYSQNFSVASQDTTPRDIAFNSSGTKMFVVGSSNDAVYEYNLVAQSVTLGSGSFASADVGKTIEANSGAFVLTATDGSIVETTEPTSYAQVASGSWEMYAVVYNTTDGDLELSAYAEDNPADVDEWTYNSASFSTQSQDSSSTNVVFKPDGTKMYVIGFTNNKVFQYSLSTAWDLSTASYDSVSISVNGGLNSTPIDVNFKPDGTSMYILDYNRNEILQYNLSTAWDVSTASYASKSVATPSSASYAMEFKSDGTRFFVINNTNDTINQYDLSTAWDISTASNSGDSFTVTQATDTYGMALNDAGTKLYLTNFNANTVLQYSLSTAWDITTISYDSISLDTSSVTSSGGLIGIEFSADEDKVYLLQYNSDVVYEYTSSQSVNAPSGYNAVHTTTSTDSTYWTDINSMTADEAAGDGSVYYAVSTDDRTTWSIVDNTDGIRDIVRNNSGTWQYNSNGTYGSETWTNATTNTELNALQEAMEGATSTINTFDVSTAVYSQNFSVSAQETIPTAIAFNTDGTKMFILGAGGDDVNEYTLSTGFDVSTATYSQNFSVATQETAPIGIAFNADGTKMFIAGNIGDDVNEYTLSTGFDVSTATYSQNFSVSSQDTSLRGIAFNTNGTKMFVVGTDGQDVNEYTLSTGFDVSTASYSQNFSVSAQDTAPYGIAFNTDGTKMFVVGETGQDVNEYTLSTGFDVSTASFVDSFSVASQETSPTGIAFNSDGSKMFVLGRDGDYVNEYNLGSASYTNLMNKTQLDAVSDANHFTLGNDLDLAIVFNQTSGTTAPSSDGVSINYDANVLNEGAILGTDYTYNAPAQNKVRITALTGNNLKIRVV